MPGSTLTLPVPADFDLPRAVCSYGYFVLAPNRWDGQRGRLHTSVRCGDARLVRAAVSQHGAGDCATGPGTQRPALRIKCDASVSRAEGAAIKHQVARMLRVEEDLSRFHRVHRRAKRARFGRLFRSATLFEDIVKTMTGCNVTWPNTVRMNALLCEHVGEGGFPTPLQLARQRAAMLKRTCKVGYRAERIIKLAREVDSGRLDLAWFERDERSTDEIVDALRRIHGVGPYAAANLCQLLGRYDRLAIDTETYRHFRQRHNTPTPKTSAGLRRLHKRIHKHYEPYAPYQFLAYWFELWGAYEDRFGDARAWGESPPVTASQMK